MRRVRHALNYSLLFAPRLATLLLLAAAALTLAGLGAPQQAAADTDTSTRTDGRLAIVAAEAEKSLVAVTTRYQVGENQGQPTFQETHHTGFIASADGLIVSVKFKRAKGQHTVTLPDGKRLPARELVVDRRGVLILLKVDAKNLKPLSLATPNIEDGQPVVTVYTQPERRGFMSASGTIARLFILKGTTALGRQTTIPGNVWAGGAPVLDEQGRLLGVNHQVYLDKGKQIGPLFTVDGEYVSQLIQARASNGLLVELKPGMMGMRMTNNPEDKSAKVTEVVEGSAAGKAGVLTDDLITSFDGSPVSNGMDVVMAGRLRKAGDTVQLEITRGEEQLTIPLTLLPAKADDFQTQRPETTPAAEDNATPDKAKPSRSELPPQPDPGSSPQPPRKKRQDPP